MNPRTRIAIHAGVATLLASSALGALYEDIAWLPAVAIAIALVVVGCEGARSLRLPSFVGPLAAAALVLMFLTAGWAHGVALLGFLPGPTALARLGDVARDGFKDVSALAAPVPTRRGLVLLATVGLAAVALVVDLIAVSMRRPALAGLPLLALLAVASSVAPNGAGWLAFTLTAVGYLSLLLAESRDRLGRWGRAFGAHDRPPALFSADAGEPSPLAVLARRIGATAIGVAVVVPLLVPGLHEGIRFGSGDGPGLGRGGSSSVTTYNPIVRIRDDLNTSEAKPLLRVRTDDPDPTYLRMTSLDEFDGESWSASEISANQKGRVSKGIKVPPIEAEVPARAVETRISSDHLDVHWLPVPYSPQSVSVRGDWRFDPETATVFSARRTTRELAYRVESRHPQPTADQLATAPAADSGFGSLTLPKDLPPKIAELAVNVTRQSTTVFEKAVAIQNYLTSKPFVYDQSGPSGNGNNALETFLFETHRGFCEQYAAAMAVLARAIGIPSRVAVGFTRGTRQPDGSWLITTHDAHAWPELYFPGIGWLQFEPTPRGDGQAVAPGYTQIGSTGGDPTPETSVPEPAPSATASGTVPHRLIEGDRTGAPVPAATRTSTTRSRLWWLLVVPLLLAVPRVLRSLTRRRRWSRAAAGPAARAHAGWAELRDGVRDLGLPWRASDTPRGAITRLRALTELPDGPAATALAQLRRAEERARYAPADAVGDPGNLRAAVRAAQAGLAVTVPRWRRALAVVFPTSTVQWVGWLFERAADLLDAVDLALARTRARVVGLAGRTRSA